MRAEDRDAIRTLMAVNSEKKKKERPRSDKSRDNNNNKNKNKANGGRKWWKKNGDVDPISLEPLSELEYPPFECRKHLFDGQVLAFYLVSTGTFTHPMSRDPLTVKDCESLDTYLYRNKLAPARVADAFRLQQAIVMQGSSSNANEGGYSAQAETQRRHATAVLHSLFGFARYGDEVPRATTGASVAQALADDEDDEDRDEETEVENDDEEGDEEDFPALLTDEAEAATTISAQHQSNWVRETGLSAGADREADFPALPGGAPSAQSSMTSAAPRFRNAVTSYVVSATTERQPQQASRYAASARAVAEDFPELGMPRSQVSRAPPSWQTVSAARPTRQDDLTKRQRERLRKREQKKAGGSAVARIREAAGEEALAILREQALNLRRGEIDSHALYDIAKDILPRDSFFDLFSGLVNIIPDPDARRELETLIKRRKAVETQQQQPQPAALPPQPPRQVAAPPPARPAVPPPPQPPQQQQQQQPVSPPAAAPTQRQQQTLPKKSDFPGLAPSSSSSSSRAQQPQKRRVAGSSASWSSALRQYGAKPPAKTGISVVVPRSRNTNNK